MVGGVRLPTGEVPQHPAIDCAERDLPRLCASAQTGHVLQKPDDLACGEEGVVTETGAFGEDRA